MPCDGRWLDGPVAVDRHLREHGVEVLAVALEQRVGDVGDLAERGLEPRRLATLAELGRQELAGDRAVVVLGLAAVAGRDDQPAPLVDVPVERAPVALRRAWRR